MKFQFSTFSLSAWFRNSLLDFTTLGRSGYSGSRHSSLFADHIDHVKENFTDQYGLQRMFLIVKAGSPHTG